MSDAGQVRKQTYPRVERIELLDVLRGFALLGMLTVNVEWFSRPWQEFGQGLGDSQGLDRIVDWVVYLAARGKFLAMFALLFGMSFAAASMRADQDGRDFPAMFLRRNVFLWLLGLANALLVWPGDILHVFALASLGLLLVRRWSERTQLLLGLAIYAALCVGALLSSHDGRPGWADGQSALAAANVYRLGHWWQVTVQRMNDVVMLLPHDLTLVPMAFALFLCGGWLVWSGRIVEVHANAGFFLRVAVIGGGFGSALTLFALYAGAAGAAVRMLGVLILAFAYIGAIAFAHTIGWLRQALSILAPVGRMPLSNYLLQTLVGSTLFFGYGLDLWGKLGRAEQLLLVLVIFAAQIALSRWWLTHFHYGPLEWIWRWFTYWKRPLMRRAASV